MNTGVIKKVYIKPLCKEVILEPEEPFNIIVDSKGDWHLFQQQVLDVYEDEFQKPYNIWTDTLNFDVKSTNPDLWNKKW